MHNHRNRYVGCKQLRATGKMDTPALQASGITYLKPDGTFTECDLNALSEFTKGHSDILKGMQSTATTELSGQMQVPYTDEELEAMDQSEIDAITAAILAQMAAEVGGTAEAT